MSEVSEIKICGVHILYVPLRREQVTRLHV